MRTILTSLGIIVSTFLTAQTLTIESGGAVFLDDGAKLFIERGGILQEGGSFSGGEVFIIDRDFDGKNIIEANAGLDFNYLELNGDAQVEMTGVIQVAESLIQGGELLELINAQVFIFPDAAFEGDFETLFGDTNSFIRAQRRASASNTSFLGEIGVTVHNGYNTMGATTVYRRWGDFTIDNRPTAALYYEVSPENNSNLNVDISFHIPDHELNGIARDNLALYRSDDGGMSWVFEGGEIIGKTVRVNDVSQFSLWAFVDNSTALPVELIFFNAEAINNNSVFCTWETATEENNSHFEIERSENGIDFEYVGQVIGAGTVSTIQQYSFLDEAPYLGTSYYRLKQVDLDGSFDFSPIEVVELSNSVSIMVYPNPTLDRVNLIWPEKLDIKRFELYSMTGQLVLEGDLLANNSEISIGSLSSGSYLLILYEGSKRHSIRLMKF
ncbi:MAG: T9SS type A sorting domain-containing protein [Saprospiraceae bacterium]|nr:T9SS type A sorting domain-containing protein [Saprospiraceae bacterium]